MKTPTDQWRVFIAIELQRKIRARLAEHIKSLRDAMPDVRASWIREDNLHLTLKFFGDVPVARIESLSTAVASASRTIQPFEILVGDCGAFPPRDQPRVLWIGIEDTSN